MKITSLKLVNARGDKLYSDLRYFACPVFIKILSNIQKWGEKSSVKINNLRNNVRCLYVSVELVINLKLLIEGNISIQCVTYFLFFQFLT